MRLTSYVSGEQSKCVVGLIQKSDQDTLSQRTSDLVKPDIPYGYPLLKIHKLTETEIREKKIPPSRFVTDLSRGVTARSDKFAVWKWLEPLARDHCIGLRLHCFVLCPKVWFMTRLLDQRSSRTLIGLWMIFRAKVCGEVLRLILKNG